jgi:hypothetical protein
VQCDVFLAAGRRPRRDAGVSIQPAGRRLCLDLIGLPPTLEQIDDFVNAYLKEFG